MRRPSRWIALMAAIGLALAISAPAFGYVHQTPRIVIVSPFHRMMRCGTYYTVKATVLDTKGKADQGRERPLVLQEVAVHATTRSATGSPRPARTVGPTPRSSWHAGPATASSGARSAWGSKAVSGTAVVHVVDPPGRARSRGSPRRCFRTPRRCPPPWTRRPPTACPVRPFRWRSSLWRALPSSFGG